MSVLGWPEKEIFTESFSGGDFIDYKLTVKGLSRLVVEAKRDSRELGTEYRQNGYFYRLNGAVFKTEAAKEGILQAIRYCGQKNAELACVTNGCEWIVFRGSRLGDGKDSLEGVAYVFNSLRGISEKFQLFYDLLAYEHVQDFKYRSFFQSAEGQPISTLKFIKQLRTQESRRLVPRDKLYTDLEKVMTSFFRRLSGDEDPALLSECFVTTKESQIADEHLARISEDLVSRVRELTTDEGGYLAEVVERVQSSRRNEFILLIGTKGAGKSTYIERFFSQVLDKKLAASCVVVRIDVGDCPGDEATIVSWLDQHLLVELERSLYPDGPPDFNVIQGMFFDIYESWRIGHLQPLYNKDKEAFKIEFGKHVYEIRKNNPNDYIKRLIHDIAKSRNKVPCLVFDNADHFTIEFQERVFQYARSIYESELSLVIVPITDRTSWQLSREGALRSFENEAFFLPTPPPSTVLKKRVEFLEKRLDEEKRQPGRGYFTSRGIALSLDNLTAFANTLQTVFLSTGKYSSWIGNLANHDIRRCLEIAKVLISSPHLGVQDLMRSYISNTTLDIPYYKVVNALIKTQYDIYSSDVNPHVHNIYALSGNIEGSPLLGLRLLRLLRDYQKANPKDPYVDIQQIVDYFSGMLVDQTVTINWLGKLLVAGLCLSYDHTIKTINRAQRLEISTSGLHHYRWGTRSIDYLLTMMEITPIADLEYYDELCVLFKDQPSRTWRKKIETFGHYLISQDEQLCRVPQHETYVTQGELSKRLKRFTGWVDNGQS